MPASTTNVLSSQARRSGSALRHLCSPRTWWSAAVTVNRGNTAIAPAVRVGVAVGLVLVVGGLLGHRDLAGFAALGSLTSAFCRADPYRVRLPRLLVVGGAVVLYVGFGAILGASGSSIVVQIVAISSAAGLAALLVSALRLMGPGAVVLIFAAAGAAGFATTVGDVGRLLVAAIIGACVGIAASLAPWARDALRSDDRHRIAERAHVLADLRGAVNRRLLMRSARIVAACAIAAGIAVAAGLQHPMWAAMGALASLQGVDYHATVHRGVQRLLGNVVGAALAIGLLALPLGYWGAVALIVVLQVAAEILATVNYALCSLAVTPMALLLTGLGAGLTADVAVDRVADTAVGVVCGVVLAALTVARHEFVGSAPIPVVSSSASSR
ncbi:FUSC family protein [Williamsia soli]|uniref:FUSC family protein n=1 Tax=Williamsia soli TaxID=364929 RepID=UPI00355672BD